MKKFGSLCKILILTVSFFVTQNSYAQCLNNVDFNTWDQEGNPNYGNWVIKNSGSTLQQTKNSAQTFYVSPFDLINVQISGTLTMAGYSPG